MRCLVQLMDQANVACSALSSHARISYFIASPIKELWASGAANSASGAKKGRARKLELGPKHRRHNLQTISVVINCQSRGSRTTSDTQVVLHADVQRQGSVFKRAV